MRLSAPCSVCGSNSWCGRPCANAPKGGDANHGTDNGRPDTGIQTAHATKPRSPPVSGADPTEFHPIAEIFPLMEGEPYKDLVKDILLNGLRQSIITYEGMILDGRNRYRACLDADVAPRFAPYKGADPIGCVVSLNLKRRHLTDSERAAVAAKVATMKKGGNRSKGSMDTISTAQAASLLNVSTISVKRAKVVERKATPKVRKAVAEGRMALRTASEIADLPKPEQDKIVALDKDQITEKLKAVKKRKEGERVCVDLSPDLLAKLDAVPGGTRAEKLKAMVAGA